jgi:hypothetical protein
VGDPVGHIELRNWADGAVVAPASANTLAKMAGGLCDNLLTCIVRAWDFRKPLLARFPLFSSSSPACFMPSAAPSPALCRPCHLRRRRFRRRPSSVPP